VCFLVGVGGSTRQKKNLQKLRMRSTPWLIPLLGTIVHSSVVIHGPTYLAGPHMDPTLPSTLKFSQISATICRAPCCTLHAPTNASNNNGNVFIFADNVCFNGQFPEDIANDAMNMGYSAVVLPTTWDPSGWYAVSDWRANIAQIPVFDVTNSVLKSAIAGAKDGDLVDLVEDPNTFVNSQMVAINGTYIAILVIFNLIAFAASFLSLYYRGKRIMYPQSAIQDEADQNDQPENSEYGRSNRTTIKARPTATPTAQDRRRELSSAFGFIALFDALIGLFRSNFSSFCLSDLINF
jgi:hypothetical protein